MKGWVTLHRVAHTKTMTKKLDKKELARRAAARSAAKTKTSPKANQSAEQSKPKIEVVDKRLADITMEFPKEAPMATDSQMATAARIPTPEQKDLENKQKQTTPIRLGRIDRIEAIDYDIDYGQQIVFRSRVDCVKGLRIPNRKELRKRRFKFRIDMQTGVVTRELADAWSDQCGEGVTVREICAALVADSAYGREFMIVSAPGYQPTPRVARFNKKCLRLADKKKTKVLSGVRATAAKQQEEHLDPEFDAEFDDDE